MNKSKPFYSILCTLFVSLLLLLSSSTLMAAPDTQIRSEIPDQFKWNLNDIYPSWDAWQADMTRLEKMMDEYAALKGTISQGPQQLLKAMKLNDDLSMILYKVYRYPQLMYDTDTRANEVAAKMQQVMTVYSKFQTATSWVNPELLSIGMDKLNTWFDQVDELAPYHYGIENLYREQQHVLDEKGEKLISYFSQFGGTPEDVYSKLSTADIKFPTIELANGDSITLTRAQYGLLLTTDKNQGDRAKAFENAYGVFDDDINTYAAIYNSVCQRDWAQAQARNYKTTLEAALDADNVPTEVYENLVSVVKAGTEPIKRYYRLRKQILGLKDYHLYDGAISIVDYDKTYEFPDIENQIVQSVAVFGKAYQDKVRTAFSSRWIDVYENEGKSSGAYSARVYGVHPYMLLNYNGTLNSVFTVAHEMGHTMHTLLSQENQPFVTSDYTIFVAEVASTLNEELFLDYKLAHVTDPKEKIAMLVHEIDNIDGTFYTQVMFSDFEMQAHRMVEQGQPITAEVLNDLMTNLLKEYYGDTVNLDELYGILWARISHFFEVPYYVYKYATCFASSAQLHKEITSSDKKLSADAVRRHLELLKSGGNDYPMKQLQKAGVDLTKPETMQAVVDQLDQLVTLLEHEVQSLNNK